jgi:2-polyprenyl-6-methoxyphenol hydroxylase-like FAD-dependent oxidoreductase
MCGAPGRMKTRVLIVGGGPVGLTLAIDLAWRRIDVVVAERRPPNDPPNVKCGQIGARSMEIFRRLGVADKLRGIGLPADYPNDIVSATSVTGVELSRVLMPARGARLPQPDRTRPGRRPSTRHASLQSEVLRAGVVRTRCGAAAHPHPVSHRDHGLRAGPAGRDGERRRPRWRLAHIDRMRLPRRMRRGEFFCPQVDRL